MQSIQIWSHKFLRKGMQTHMFSRSCEPLGLLRLRKTGVKSMNCPSILAIRQFFILGSKQYSAQNLRTACFIASILSTQRRNGPRLFVQLALVVSNPWFHRILSNHQSAKYFAISSQSTYNFLIESTSLSRSLLCAREKRTPYWLFTNRSISGHLNCPVLCSWPDWTVSFQLQVIVCMTWKNCMVFWCFFRFDAKSHDNVWKGRFIVKSSFSIHW
jgi:hypothetical protein